MGWNSDWGRVQAYTAVKWVNPSESRGLGEDIKSACPPIWGAVAEPDAPISSPPTKCTPQP